MSFLNLDQIKSNYRNVKQAFDDIRDIFANLETLELSLLLIPRSFHKNSNNFITYPYNESKAKRSTDNDRVFPIDTVLLERFRIKHDYDVDKATIHTGPYADELVRSYGALALTIGHDIYFRNKAYDPSSEEGRKTLAHELTHVNQNKEWDSNRNKNIKEFESEAEKTENRETLEEDSIIPVKLKGRSYELPKSKMRYYAKILAKRTHEWVGQQKYVLCEQEFLKLLCKYVTLRDRHV